MGTQNEPVRQMRAAIIFLPLLLSGCVSSTTVAPVPEKQEIVRVVRLTEERDVRYEIQSIDPPPEPLVVYTSIRFRVEEPEAFGGNEISLPILRGMEGQLFNRKVFRLKIPAYVLEGKHWGAAVHADGTTQLVGCFGFNFDALIVEPIKSPQENPEAASPVTAAEKTQHP